MATIADLDITTQELEQRLREGRKAECRHLLHDPDPDDTACADRARKASRRAALVTQAARRFLVRMEEQ